MFFIEKADVSSLLTLKLHSFLLDHNRIGIIELNIENSKLYYSSL